MSVEYPEYHDSDSEQNSDLASFIDELRSNQEQILAQVDAFLHRPNKIKEEIVLGIYLDVVLKSEVFGIDPFASKRPGDEEVQEDRMVIAFMATEYVAHEWLATHPESEVAREIVEHGIYAGTREQFEFLHEMWGTISSHI
jgi:hypothetical protein